MSYGHTSVSVGHLLLVWLGYLSLKYISDCRSFMHFHEKMQSSRKDDFFI